MRQLVLKKQLNKGRLEMKNKKMMNMLTCMLIIASVLILNAYAADVSGTYTDSLLDDNNPIDIYLEGEYVGEYIDFRIYQVNLDKDQNIELRLEVPNEADFDLFVYTQDDIRGWGSMLDAFGADEELNIIVPETGAYTFIVASWDGSGGFTLRWETPGVGFSIPIYVLIAIVVIVIVIIAVIFLKRRRTPVKIPRPPGYNFPSVPAPVMPEVQQSLCPHCSVPLTWIEKYQRWYCYECSKYI